MPIKFTSLPGIPIIQSGDDLVSIILASLQQAGINLLDSDILVLTQKIVSKAEGRLFNLAQVTSSEAAKQLAAATGKDPRLVELILRESRHVLRSRPGSIIVEHHLGFVCASAGIDHSNVQGEGEWVLLLPENPDASAQRIRAGLEEASGKRLGAMIIDSHGRAWRLGTVGVAIGLAGLPGLIDLRGRPDLFGYTLRITLIGAADELAAGASLVMGQAAEGTPVVHVRGFPYLLSDGSLQELLRPRESDLFR
jgi:coenzyme F420-0:L-glutamate ligase/coenzyme F420-1:gamma-L-glutamate ligase